MLRCVGLLLLFILLWCVSVVCVLVGWSCLFAIGCADKPGLDSDSVSLFFSALGCSGLDSVVRVWTRHCQLWSATSWHGICLQRQETSCLSFTRTPPPHTLPLQLCTPQSTCIRQNFTSAQFSSTLMFHGGRTKLGYATPIMTTDQSSSSGNDNKRKGVPSEGAATKKVCLHTKA